MPPTLILVRHAEALHNVSRDYSIHDPELSEKGQGQCRDLRKNIMGRIPKELDVGLIVVSPMRRTIETALLAFGGLIEKGIPIVAHAGWQENSAKPCDTGSPISKLQAEFPMVDFSQVDPVFPDKTTAAGARYAYSKEAIVARGQFALEDLYSRPEKFIVVVSHSGFLRQGVTGSWFFNADYRIFDFEGPASDEGVSNMDGAGGGAKGRKYKLRQWEDTRANKGGLGWSFEEEVEIGHGLPEAWTPEAEAD